MPAEQALPDSLDRRDDGPPRARDATAGLARASEMVPIEHETAERIVRTIVFAVPPAALVAGGWLAWGGSPALAGPARARDHLHAHRAGHHRRLSPAVHAPQLQDHAPVRALLAVLGSMAVEGPVIEWVATHRKHHRFSDHAGRPAQPPRRPRAGMARGAARTRPRARRLDVPRQGHGQPRPLRQGSARRPRPAASSAAPSRSGCWSAWRSPSASAWR